MCGSPLFFACAIACAGIINPAAAAQNTKLPVIIDTDIGSDFDDSAALAFAIQHPDIEVRMVLTATGDTTARAKVVAKYLTEFGRTDIPIGIGVVSDRPNGTLFPWGADYDLEKYPGTVHQDGVGAAIQLIKAAAAKGEHIQIIAIAPCNNFPPLLTAYPDIVESVSVTAMSGSVYRGYGNSTTPSKENNVVCDPEGTAAMYKAKWPVAITPLDTCGTAILRNGTYDRLLTAESLVARTLVASLFYWGRHRPMNLMDHSDIWYDVVAAYMTTSLDFLRITTVPLTVTSDGYTVVDKVNGSKVDAALNWSNEQKFLDYAVSIITKT